jgi:hypothetical protein
MSITKLAPTWNWATAHNTNTNTTTASGTPRRIITGMLTGNPADEAALYNHRPSNTNRPR